MTNEEIGLTPDLPPRLESQDKMDWNDYLKESKEKALDRSQEPLNNIGGELINRNSGYLEGEPSRTAPQPEESKTQPDFPANVQLYFNIDRSKESSVGLRNGYHYATDKDLRYLNRYAEEFQKSADWYLNELADSKVTYFYQDKEDVQMLQVDFEKRHWMHLTGIAPVYHEWAENISEQFIEDVASGKGDFANLTVGVGFRDKAKLLPMLPEIFESDSFVFDDLSSVEKMGRLDVSSAIRSDDKDILLAFRTDDNSTFPATLLKPSRTLNIELDTLNQEKTILGVFVEKDDSIKTMSINPEFVKDNGQVMLDILRQNRDFEPFKDEPNLQNGGLAMADNNEPNLRNRIEQILREDEEKNKLKHEKKSLNVIQMVMVFLMKLRKLKGQVLLMLTQTVTESQTRKRSVMGQTRLTAIIQIIKLNLHLNHKKALLN